MSRVQLAPVKLAPIKLALCIALGLAACACASPGKSEAELSQEQVCLSHFENDPVERDRCMLNPRVRGDTVPDVRPMDLPVRTGQIGD